MTSIHSMTGGNYWKASDLNGGEVPVNLNGFTVEGILDEEPDLIWLPHHDYTSMREELFASPELWKAYEVYPSAMELAVALRVESPRAGAIRGAL